jgi:hypothetical protein
MLLINPMALQRSVAATDSTTLAPLWCHEIRHGFSAPDEKAEAAALAVSMNRIPFSGDTYESFFAYCTCSYSCPRGSLFGPIKQRQDCGLVTD